MQKKTTSRAEQGAVIRGIGVSPGVASGKVLLVREADAVVERSIKGSEDQEIARLERAVIQTRLQIRELQRVLQRRAEGGESGILDAHALVLEDHLFMDEILRKIRVEQRNAEAVVLDVATDYAKLLDSVGDAFLKERVADVHDVARRLIGNLTGDGSSVLEELTEPRIVVAVDLAPSATAGLSREMVLALATDLGSSTSHTAVLARALEIPAVVALGKITDIVNDGDEVLVDGSRGLLIVAPSEKDLLEYGKLQKVRKKIVDDLLAYKNKSAITRDGHRIRLMANAEGVKEAENVIKYGAEGIGLFRSEYLFLARGEPVGEDEQAAAFEEVARRLAPRPVIIRTLDLGGDKLMPGLVMEQEPNPFLGFRSIRYCLKHPDYFKGHLRAILRASAGGKVAVMYPMICKVEEVESANEILEIAKAELRREGVPFNPNIRKGAMIEVPSAALNAEAIAKHVDFFSIGTNDLVQYTLAVDRVNEKVAYLYDPTDPAVLMLIERACSAAHAAGIDVGLCGEMAADPMLTPLLVGMNLDSLSVAPSAVPLVKDVIRRVSFSDTKSLAEHALSCKSSITVRELCRKMIHEAAPEILEML